MSVYESIVTGLNEAFEYAKGERSDLKTTSFESEQPDRQESFGLSALDVAKWLIAYNNAQENTDFLTPLKLQKLLYYAQGTAIKYTGKTLFTEPIYAWQHGPAVPTVYEQYKNYGKKPIDENFPLPEFNNDVNIILQDVYEDYGQFSAWKLVEMTHNEDPWCETPKNGKISLEKMNEFFSR